MSKGKPPNTAAANINTAEVTELLHRISDGATGSSVSLGEILRLCIRLGNLLSNEELMLWAKSEVMGYEKVEGLPDYRVLSAEVRATFHGPFGSGIKNTVLPESFIEKDHRDILCKSYMTQSVAELEHLAKASNGNSNTLTANWSGDAIAYYQQKELYTNDMVLASAWRVISQSSITGILETIRTRVLDFALRIEKELGLSGHGAHQAEAVEKPAAKKVDQIVYATIYGSNVSVGNSGNLNQSIADVRPGDLAGLKSYLKEVGLTEELINDLEQALAKDSGTQIQPGQHTQNWIGKVMISLGKGSLSLATNVTGSLIAEAIMKYLGLA